MDPHSHLDSQSIITTPVKNDPAYFAMATSTPTCSTSTFHDDFESPPNKRLKLFCCTSPSEEESSNSEGFNSFEEKSPVIIHPENSFEKTCNELKLTNTIVKETILLIEETDPKGYCEGIQPTLANEQKEMLKKELCELISHKSMLETSVKEQATSYIKDSENVIDNSFLNDTVLSNLNLTLKNKDDSPNNTITNETITEKCGICSILDNSNLHDVTLKNDHVNSLSENALLPCSTSNEVGNLTSNSNSKDLHKDTANWDEQFNNSLSENTLIPIPTIKENHLNSEKIMITNSASNDVKLISIDLECSNTSQPPDVKIETELKSGDKNKEFLKKEKDHLEQDGKNLQQLHELCKSPKNMCSKRKIDGTIVEKVKNNIEFDNSIIIIGESVEHNLDKIKLEAEKQSMLIEANNNNYEKDLIEVKEKVTSLCDTIASLGGKHNSSKNTQCISKEVLAKCEILVNKMRNINNSLMVNQMQNSLVHTLKESAQYLYEVIHAIVHKTDLKKVRAPYISKNSKENYDNDDPKWNILKLLETDEDRYKAVRKRWLNMRIPDPHSCITHRTRRYPTLNKNNSPVKQGSFSEGIRNVPFEKFYEIKSKNIKKHYDNLFANLDKQEGDELDDLFMSHKQEQNTLLRNCSRNVYHYKSRNMYYRQMEETRRLKSEYGEQRRQLSSTMQSTLDSLRSQKFDTHSFLKFYDGLNGQIALKISEADLQEALETDEMISKYEDFYRKSSDY